MPSNSGLADWCERRAKEVMLARWSSELTVAQLAQECAMSPAEFERAFCEKAGMPPRQYLAQVRMNEAKGLLRQPHLSVSDIAIVCGFNSRRHFSRVFRLWTGKSPTEWKRSKRAAGYDAVAMTPDRRFGKQELLGSASHISTRSEGKTLAMAARD